MRLLIIALLCSMASAYGKPIWNDLEPGQSFRLDRPLVWPSGFQLDAGLPIQITDWVGMDMLSVLYVGAIAPDCAEPDLVAQMEIFPVPAEVGIDVEAGCKIGFFLEYADIYTTAPLE